jgi:hypothetical protein
VSRIASLTQVARTNRGTAGIGHRDGGKAYGLAARRRLGYRGPPAVELRLELPTTKLPYYREVHIGKNYRGMIHMPLCQRR